MTICMLVNVQYAMAIMKEKLVKYCIFLRSKGIANFAHKLDWPRFCLVKISLQVARVTILL